MSRTRTVVGGATVVSVGRTAWVIRRRLAMWSLLAAVVAVVLALTGLAVGFTTPVDVARILLGGGTRAENVVIFDDMLPRVLVAGFVGFGLGLAGCLTQVITRNPLATPDLLGITAGAGAAAVLALTATASSVGSALRTLGVPTAALLGGLGTAAVMYALAWRRGQVVAGVMRLVLIGVGMTWTLQSVTGYLLVRANIYDAQMAQTWMVGSLADSGWSAVPAAAAAVAVGVCWTVVIARPLGVSGLGPDLATGLGVRLGVTVYGTLLTAVIVASLAVSAAGPIAFVGLVAPQIAVRLAASGQPTPILSGTVGAAMTLAADILTRTLLPGGLPVGVVTAAVGGPFLVFLIVQTARRTAV
ncbi:FecCD family ABC transporter permease [Gordonia shandongensis]|uniref:FecCD family ABC transporter permease n=1 Tax=Gordonia shandongensis TaxID=376351 RepID=UPI0004017F38|nr:iron ABC transporter permease [Gordonia shandongensis]